MRLIGLEKLSQLRDKGEQTEKWILSWIAEVRDAHWKRPVDVRNQFPKARHDGEGRFMFSVANSQWIICLLVTFQHGIALITDLKAEDNIHGN